MRQPRKQKRDQRPGTAGCHAASGNVGIRPCSKAVPAAAPEYAQTTTTANKKWVGEERRPVGWGVEVEDGDEEDAEEGVGAVEDEEGVEEPGEGGVDAEEEWGG